MVLPSISVASCCNYGFFFCPLVVVVSVDCVCEAAVVAVVVKLLLLPLLVPTPGRDS